MQEISRRNFMKIGRKWTEISDYAYRRGGSSGFGCEQC